MTDLRHLRCWLRGRWDRIRYNRHWNGHCWGSDGSCVDCGKE